ncbi:MAG: YgiT-type zinc finger protein [Nostoc sp. DedQUE04]|uniref:YgiT-type zinc finger protein n=1 Tax=Nostoc sp. DedQUE04 TaxID=3075390 RepID=UPI002AD55868|nr:YgiT-type zinc finger protein [Nostoc sp. DedQUE04]MDZ8136249.1 YgiT-type zinc finger protein [Nostoc sp. DedQUE04]
MTLPEGEAMMSSNSNETLVEQTVTYTLEMNGKFYLIENVPARVNPETGEQFFSPSTVERLQQIIYNQQQPVRILETPVYDFAA